MPEIVLSIDLPAALGLDALWGVPGDVLAAPASALCGWKGVILSPYLSLSLPLFGKLHYPLSFSIRLTM